MDKCAGGMGNIFYIVTYLCLFMLRVVFFKSFYIQADSSATFICINFQLRRRGGNTYEFGSHKCFEYTAVTPTTITRRVIALLQAKPSLF